jgi:hypothetical protein
LKRVADPVYLRGTMSKPTLLVLLAVLLPGPAGATWVVDERGECVEEWTTASLARGPAAIANAPLLPVRSAVGGVALARDDKSPGKGRSFLLPPLLAVAGAGMGLIEGGIWLGTGLVDTLTGGYFSVAPDEATHLGVDPVTPLFVTDVRRDVTDPCGRKTAVR